MKNGGGRERHIGKRHGGGTHGAYLDLIAVEVLLCEGGEEEDDLCFDDGVDVGARGTVHGWGAGPG